MRKVYNNRPFGSCIIKLKLSKSEGSAKSKIKNILKYKKPTVIVSITAIILCFIIAVVCIANPKDSNDELMLLGFVYQDEDNNDSVKCISEIKNDGYKQKIIDKSEAIKIAYEKQTTLYPDMNISLNNVELKNVSEQYYGFNTIYNPNGSGHSYYGVSYFDNDTVCDFYYYCVDAVTGEIIFNSMMGD